MLKNNNQINRRKVVKAILAGTATIAAGHPLITFSKESKANLESQISGSVFWKDNPEYENVRGACSYKINKPKRYPRVIVQPLNDQDVVAAVNFAREHKLKVTTRSGGHAWSASHVREDCLLIDMSRMQNIEIDTETKTVWVNPGVLGSRINAELKQHGLLIPTAHHISPGIGGFTMNGGFGWNSRKVGNGARQLIAIDVVTAEGKLIRADLTQNTDFLWAARGSGQGFFGVVTKMHIQAHDRPKYWARSVYGFREEQFEELFTWARNINSSIPDTVEMVVVSTAHDSKTGEPAPLRITCAAMALVDSAEEALQALSFMKSCPVRDKAYFKFDAKETSLEELYVSGYTADPAGHRFATDNFYTEAPADVLIPRIKEVFTKLPTHRTHTFWHSWGPIKPYPDDMALSMQADVYIATYTLWKDPSQDNELEKWPVDQIKALDDLSIGGQMNDENMLFHPQNYLSAAAYEKLEKLRAIYDPERVFETFMGTPRKPV